MNFTFTITSYTQNNIMAAIKNYYKFHGTPNVKRHLGIKKDHLKNIYEQMTNGHKYKNIEEMFINFNREKGTNRKLKIKKKKYKRVILLLLSYNNKLIVF